MCDDGQRLERRSRERALRRQQVRFDHVPGNRRRREPVTPCDFAQDDAAFAILGLDVLQHRGDLALFGVQQLCKLRDRERLACDEEQRFDRTLQSRDCLVEVAHPAAFGVEKSRISSKASGGSKPSRRRRTNSRIARNVTTMTSRVIPSSLQSWEKYASPDSLIRRIM